MKNIHLLKPFEQASRLRSLSKKPLRDIEILANGKLVIKGDLDLSCGILVPREEFPPIIDHVAGVLRVSHNHLVTLRGLPSCEWLDASHNLLANLYDAPFIGTMAERTASKLGKKPEGSKHYNIDGNSPELTLIAQGPRYNWEYVQHLDRLLHQDAETLLTELNYQEVRSTLVKLTEPDDSLEIPEKTYANACEAILERLRLIAQAHIKISAQTYARKSPPLRG